MLVPQIWVLVLHTASQPPIGTRGMKRFSPLQVDFPETAGRGKPCQLAASLPFETDLHKADIFTLNKKNAFAATGCPKRKGS